MHLSNKDSLYTQINRKELIKALQLFPRLYMEVRLYSDGVIELKDDTKYVKLCGVK